MTHKKNETERILRVNYTDPERLELGKQLAEVHNNLSQTNSDFDRVKAEFKSKISAHEAQIIDLSNKVSTGYRMVPVKCLWEMDKPKRGMKRLLRLDIEEAKDAVVEVTDMTDADKQADLPLAEDSKAGIAGDGTVKVGSDKENKR